MPLTKKQQKIIKARLKYLGQWWKKQYKKVNTDILNSKDFQDFLERTQTYTTNNIMDTELAEPISQDVIRAQNWSKLANYELVQQTIREYTMNLIHENGEDFKNELRELVAKGYNLGLSNEEIAKSVLERDLKALYIVPEEGTFNEDEWNNLPQEKQLKFTISNNIRRVSPETRSKTIVRTEVNRAGNLINYIQAQNEGALGFRVICRNDCCKLCAQKYQDINDYKPAEKKTGLLTNGELFNMDDIESLPPVHPNCRCSAEFEYDNRI